MMALIGRGSEEESSALRMERRKPSAACRVIWLPWAVSSTPVSTGRASSVEAANATCWIISLSVGHIELDPVGEVRGGHGGKFLSVDAVDVGVGGATAHVELLVTHVEDSSPPGHWAGWRPGR